ncbi:putative glyoxal oxidase [Daldinia vernicosa]|uniref:putative glyoxal oxidase n=1 Tax=Daldinia vernicosa TaxID=114800 RepID=UPI002007BCA2|nr:putative glyoxal oxidase [Daldinia vernicosa]KAI0852681.1 putative glyoxal oxidase [Daldinia vernicosa]
MRAIQALSSFFFTISLTLTSFSIAQQTVLRVNQLNGKWHHKGCYVDAGRIINVAATTSDTKTPENCVEFCDSRGFAYAEAKHHNECYCGNELASGALEVRDSRKCSSGCSGDDAEACEGSNWLTLFFNPYSAGPRPNIDIPDWVHIGCYSEGIDGRCLTYKAPISTMPVDAESCTSVCLAAGYTFAGTKNGDECYCGNTTANGAVLSDGCDTACKANDSEVCGGLDRLNVYNFKRTPSGSTRASSRAAPETLSGTLLKATTLSIVARSIVPRDATTEPVATSTSSVSSASSSPTAPSQPSVIGDYIWYGCQTEATNIRALSLYTYADDAMTLGSCQTFCSGKGTTYFGVEYARECYCGNKFEAGSVEAPESDCNMLCAGDQWAYCGSGNRLSVYIKNGTSVATSTVSSGPTSSDPGTPEPTGFPDGWTDQGCWQDGPNGRIMPTFQAPDDSQLTPQKCAQLCADNNYTVSGTEYYTQCFCSNAIYNGGVRGEDTSKCSTPCGGNSQVMCGGAGYLSIYSKGTPQTFKEPAPLQEVNGTWTYQGCYEDNVNNQRTLFWSLTFLTPMTPEQCLGKCASFGYAAGGLEYGQECYCGDPMDVDASGATIKPESECNIACAGNASTICGGGARLSMYYWTGETPLYVFNYPEGNDAGSYSNLVGGVVTPLMTMQSITGKVTFLEKWGTGAANSTGAYELDLSCLDDFDAAWRTMHVKTDIFCSAGVILPDKAGRQLTIGGWSLDSTYGVRLYAPDGSDGVKGTNDWEEDVNTLKLQRGRWYPSAMLMANGSILVVGGEIGSNDKPEPSLEILPKVGPYLNMDWLERTDPNNLYPFLAVLPGGGIFVAYWNEARILDEVTFDTIQTLPNMPGAVNDDLGGRTYPLEGATVLLPQFAPYTDPLGILLCGGSTDGHSALDNCVSTYPEAPNPEWTLERMPSKRVMSCMAPLPDGTYLIANGAHEGVAGFGLADDPNYNAILYDPFKPIGSRMSVMANTTVARLYHSEAITLLDGRVLITGSDPEDGKHPQEMRVEVFTPPYLYSSKPRPSFTVTNKDWDYNEEVAFELGSEPEGEIQVSLLGAVSSTHGNSMGARTLFPEVSCDGTTCTVVAPPRVHIAPAGWYQMYVLQDKIPAVGTYVRIGGDPGKLGNWPPGDDFTRPGV